MTVLNTAGARLVLLLACHVLWLAPAHSQAAASPGLDEQVTRQEGIIRSEGNQRPEGYVIDRSLSHYAGTLCDGFDRSLASLGPEDRWLDIGAGQGQAILDYFAPDFDSEGRERHNPKASAVAISIEDRRTPVWHKTAAALGANKIRYYFNRRLSEYSLEELGRFQIITDVVGGFSYAFDLSRFVAKALGLLELNGSFYTLLQDVHAEDGSNNPYYKGSPFLTEIANPDGSKVNVCSWLKSIECVEVTCEFKANWEPPIEAYRIRKVCNEVTVPALLPVHYEAGTPPERRFQLTTPVITHRSPPGTR